MALAITLGVFVLSLLLGGYYGWKKAELGAVLEELEEMKKGVERERLVKEDFLERNKKLGEEVKQEKIKLQEVKKEVEEVETVLNAENLALQGEEEKKKKLESEVFRFGENHIENEKNLGAMKDNANSLDEKHKACEKRLEDVQEENRDVDHENQLFIDSFNSCQEVKEEE